MQSSVSFSLHSSPGRLRYSAGRGHVRWRQRRHLILRRRLHTYVGPGVVDGSASVYYSGRAGDVLRRRQRRRLRVDGGASVYYLRVARTLASTAAPQTTQSGSAWYYDGASYFRGASYYRRGSRTFKSLLTFVTRRWPRVIFKLKLDVFLIGFWIKACFNSDRARIKVSYPLLGIQFVREMTEF